MRNHQSLQWLKSLFSFFGPASGDRAASVVPVPRRQLRLRQRLQEKQTADFYYLVDIVGACNLRCPSCPVGNYPAQPPGGVMPLERYKAIVEKIAREHPGEKIFIDLYNWGEPSLHKDLGEIIALTKNHGFNVGVSTNLNRFPRFGEAAQGHPTYLRISLSGFCNEVYQQTHRGGDIETVKANMRRLREWLDATKSETIVQVGFHIYKSNFPDDFFAMQALCHSFDFIFAPTLAAIMPVEKALQAVDGLSNGDEEVLTKLVVATDERVAILSKMRDRYPDCQYRQKRTTINFDLSVPICCATFEQSNLIAENFLEVSRAELMARKYAHPFCKECQKRSLDMVYTGAEPQLVEVVARDVLGPKYDEFLKEWNVPLEPVVDWDGKELSLQQAYDEAQEYSARGDGKSAKALLRELVAVSPRHGEGHLSLGRMLEREGDLEAALASYQGARALCPEHEPYCDAVKRLELKIGATKGASRT